MRGIPYLVLGLIIGSSLCYYYLTTLNEVDLVEEADIEVASSFALTDQAREVTHVQIEGTAIRRICNPGEEWSPVSVEDAIQQVEQGQFTYFVEVPIDIVTVNGRTGKYLRTNRTRSDGDNLRTRPSCDAEGNPLP